MNKVEQQHMYPPRGDCVNACIASIFEIPLADLKIEIAPGFNQICKWTKSVFPFLEFHSQDFCKNYRIINEEEGIWTYDLPTEKVEPPCEGYWMAYAVSPRGKLIDGPYKGNSITHAVVMYDDKLAWDPHPQRDMGIGQILERTWWTVREGSNETSIHYANSVLMEV